MILARTTRPRLQPSFHFTRWENSFLNSRFTHGKIVFPKPRPVAGIKRIRARTARNHRTEKRPLSRFFDQPTLQRIEQDIIRTRETERPPLPFRRGQDMVVRLMLELGGFEKRTDLGAEKLDAVALVGVTAQPHPDKMNVVRHQAVSRTYQSFTRRRVKHHLAKGGVKTVGKPALLTMGNRHGPEDDGVGLVEFTFQPRQIVGEIRTWFPFRMVGNGQRFRIHSLIMARTHVRGYVIFRSRRRQSAQTSRF